METSRRIDDARRRIIINVAISIVIALVIVLGLALIFNLDIGANIVPMILGMAIIAVVIFALIEAIITRNNDLQTAADMGDPGEILLEAVREAGGEWISREELQTIMGKSALSPMDVLRLENMAEKGVIEMQRRSGKIPSQITWYYRFKGEEA